MLICPIKVQQMKEFRTDRNKLFYFFFAFLRIGMCTHGAHSVFYVSFYVDEIKSTNL
jgi:hypothetical protein